MVFIGQKTFKKLNNLKKLFRNLNHENLILKTYVFSSPDPHTMKIAENRTANADALKTLLIDHRRVGAVCPSVHR